MLYSDVFLACRYIYYYNKVELLGSVKCLLKKYAIQHLCVSVTYVKSDNFLAKKCFADLVGMQKSSTFAPAIERDAVQIEILKQSWGYELPLQKKLFEKKLRKSFGSSKIVLTFASAFEKKAIKKSSLKDLDMNKQVVQDYLL